MQIPFYLLFYIFFFALLPFSILGSNTYERELILHDSFDNNLNEWHIVDFNDSQAYETKVTKSGQYLCHLPEETNWGFTWVGVPDKVSNLIAGYSNLDLEFTLEIKDRSTSRPPSLGFMFDTHNVTDDCPGGDARAILLQQLSSSLFESVYIDTKTCRAELNSFIRGSAISASQDKLTIRFNKRGYHWSVFLNDQLSLEFEAEGVFNLEHLQFGIGQYLIDDFKIYVEKQKVDKIETKTNVYVILIGISDYSDYQNEVWTDLNYCHSDAAKMFDFYTSPYGGSIDPNHINLLVNEEATYENILKSTTELSELATENDLLIFYFSGHGAPNIFAAHDQNILIEEELKGILFKSEAKQKLCIADACHSGSWKSSKSVLEKSMTDDQIKAIYWDALRSTENGIALFMSARADEKSLEVQSKKQSLFTFHFLEALKGAANFNSDLIISIEELYNYVLRAVSDEARRLGKAQNPQLKGKIDYKLPIAVVKPN